MTNLCNIRVNLYALDKKQFDEPNFEVCMNKLIEIRDRVRQKEAMSID